ncbi:sigma-70 family RNA polymerase sigma factor [Candidatus Woesearchaeota archaeon]|nr:sigma-70 family RNA polymerase sigma factor [Candidatus Woesearchaeota archaeon]
MPAAYSLPTNILSRDIYVIEEYLKLYQNIRKRKKASYSRIKLSFSQLFHLIKTGELLQKPGKHEKRFSITEIVRDQIECYEANNKKEFPDKVLEKYGFKRHRLKINEPELRIVPKKPYSDAVLDPLRAYYAEIKKYPVLTRERERELIERTHQGDKEAEEKMIYCNQRLVASIARKFLWSGFDVLDLIQAGNLGLLRALKKFNTDKGNKFSTYATFWIRQKIWREIKQNKSDIRIPDYLYDYRRKFKKIQRDYLSSRGTLPTLDEICSETGWSKEDAKRVIKVSLSIESCYNLEGIKDLDKLLTHDKIEKKLLIIKIKEIFSSLDERSQDIIRRRFGFDNQRGESLGEIGKTYNISRERVRQIEEECLDFFRSELGLETKRVNYVSGVKHFKPEYVEARNKSRRKRIKKLKSKKS